MKLYISDLHFYHEKLNTGLDNRGFCDLKTMHEYMITQWNNKVQGGDIVYVLGDLFFTNNVDEVNHVLNRLKGKICLIEGNHDKQWLKKEGVNLDRFEWVKGYAEVNESNKRIAILSHYPVFCYNHQYLKNPDGSDRTYMMYGHVHNTHDEILVNRFINMTKETVLKGSVLDRKIPCNMINCFCMFSDYVPLSLDEWIAVDETRRSAMAVQDGTEIRDEL